MTIEEAFKIREELKALGKHSASRKVLESILYGDYDRYKDEAKEIAASDIEFLQSNGNTK